MDDRPDAATLVEVGPGAKDQRATAGISDRDRPHDARVPGDGRLGEARDSRILDSGNRLADQVSGLPPAGAEHKCDVVAGRTRLFGDHLGRRGCDRERVDGGVAQIQGFSPRVGHAGSLTRRYRPYFGRTG